MTSIDTQFHGQFDSADLVKFLKIFTAQFVSPPLWVREILFSSDWTGILLHIFTNLENGDIDPQVNYHFLRPNGGYGLQPDGRLFWTLLSAKKCSVLLKGFKLAGMECVDNICSFPSSDLTLTTNEREECTIAANPRHPVTAARVREVYAGKYFLMFTGGRSLLRLVRDGVWKTPVMDHDSRPAGLGSQNARRKLITSNEEIRKKDMFSCYCIFREFSK